MADDGELSQLHSRVAGNVGYAESTGPELAPKWRRLQPVGFGTCKTKTHRLKPAPQKSPRRERLQGRLLPARSSIFSRVAQHGQCDIHTADRDHIDDLLI